MSLDQLKAMSAIEDLLPVPYFYVGFMLPAAIAAIAYQSASPPYSTPGARR